MELKGEMERHEHRIQFNEDRMRDWQAQNTRAGSEIAQAEERRLIAQEELEQATQRLAASTAAVQSHQQAMKAKGEALQAVETQLRAAQEALRQAQAESFSAAQQLSRARNEIVSLDLQKEGNAARLEKLSAEKAQLEEERTGLAARLQQFSACVEAEKLNAQAHRGTLEERQQRLRALEEELARATREMDEWLRQQAENRSRLHLLEQLDAEREGFGAGALSALKNAEQVLGLLADGMRAPEPHVVAVEAALGRHLQLVLTSREESARQILDNLRAGNSGRASVAALDLHHSNGAPVPALPAGMIPVLSVVETEETVRPLLEHLLGERSSRPTWRRPGRRGGSAAGRLIL